MIRTRHEAERATLTGVIERLTKENKELREGKGRKGSRAKEEEILERMEEASRRARELEDRLRDISFQSNQDYY